MYKGLSGSKLNLCKLDRFLKWRWAYESTNSGSMAVFVDELVDWSLLTTEVLGSNLVIGKKIKHLETVNYIEK